MNLKGDQGRLEELRRLLDDLSARDVISLVLSEHIVESALNDVKELADNRYVAEGLQQAVSVIDKLFTLSNVDHIDIAAPLSHVLWSSPEVRESVIASVITAGRKGLRARCALLVDDWLKLAMDEQRFVWAKQLAQCGIAVRLIEESNTALSLSDGLINFICGTNTVASVRMNRTESSTNPLRLSVRTAGIELREDAAFFESLWGSSLAVPLEHVAT